MERYDVAVVGGGIVGLATARAVLRRRPASRVVVLEREPVLAAHQSGRNSGVLHAGVYYAPGSAKARLCTAGRTSMIRFCEERDVAHAVCGKVVVAVDERDRSRLDDLEARCAANGVHAQRIDGRHLREVEPNVAGIEALHVLDTGVVDFAAVCRALADEITAAGAEVRLGTGVVAGHERTPGLVLETTGGDLEAQRVVTCAGLHADVVARAISGPAGSDGLRVVAFRGEYHELVPDRAHLVRGLVYPVPDPDLPFLGVHLTRGIDGHVHVGPNAVLAFARHGYRWRDVDVRHLTATLADRGFRRFARAHWRFGRDEMLRSLRRRRLVASARALVPELRPADLVRAPAGVRAQAIAADGRLVDDFAFRAVGRALHVLNAPSPAATASLEIGAAIAARLALDDG